MSPWPQTSFNCGNCLSMPNRLKIPEQKLKSKISGTLTPKMPLASWIIRYYKWYWVQLRSWVGYLIPSKVKFVHLFKSDWYIPGKRNKNPWPAIGNGFNSGVILMDLERLAEVNWSQMWRLTTEKELLTFHSAMADQGFNADQVFKQVTCVHYIGWLLESSIMVTIIEFCKYAYSGSLWY